MQIVMVVVSVIVEVLVVVPTDTPPAEREALVVTGQTVTVV